MFAMRPMTTKAHTPKTTLVLTYDLGAPIRLTQSAVRDGPRRNNLKATLSKTLLPL
jgi:hypothetical protein